MMGSATIYKVVKNAYDAGRYSIDDMRLLVFTGTITAEQYKVITSFDYNEEETGEG
ncbi:XkdX family protein [Brochothrix thermosphacta]|uniref:XkdX family protein n=1 Tax=Brochothrix thermosphacta TaxID=2756 RepID=UPI0039AEB366